MIVGTQDLALAEVLLPHADVYMEGAGGTTAMLWAAWAQEAERHKDSLENEAKELPNKGGSGDKEQPEKDGKSDEDSGSDESDGGETDKVKEPEAPPSAMSALLRAKGGRLTEKDERAM